MQKKNQQNQIYKIAIMIHLALSGTQINLKIAMSRGKAKKWVSIS